MKKKLIPLMAFVLLLLVASATVFIRTRDPRIRIMPLGDSITQGPAEEDSYRRPLWKMLKTTGARVDFVGSMKRNYPDAKPAHSDFDMDHEGHWGWQTGEVLAKIDGWAAEHVPDIVLLHLGTNDILHGQKNQDTVEKLRGIIVVLRKHNSGVKIFLAQLIPMGGKAANLKIQELNQLIPDMAHSMTSEASPVRIVDQYEGFDALKDTSDGIHPNESGIEKMAQKWCQALAVDLNCQR